jgi:hypothetical protein
MATSETYREYEIHYAESASYHSIAHVDVGPVPVEFTGTNPAEAGAKAKGFIDWLPILGAKLDSEAPQV